jgi:hypothetical protein
VEDEGSVPWFYDRVALWIEIGAGAEPWRIDGYPADTTDLSVLDFWYEAAEIVIGARADATAYVESLSPAERKSRANRLRFRARHQLATPAEGA